MDIKRALPTRENLIGKSFGKLEVIGRSDKRGSRGARTVPLWECRCECGNITYKATDTLTKSVAAGTPLKMKIMAYEPDTYFSLGSVTITTEMMN